PPRSRTRSGTPGPQPHRDERRRRQDEARVDEDDEAHAGGETARRGRGEDAHELIVLHMPVPGTGTEEALGRVLAAAED
ncbi:hypothetical protein, partial [Streptomyces sp. SPB074]|uniref:hypothetical protein n=1 Tax=Streptomyces sp. (strain SPB074) TaxID=465543 RepID=UPI001F3B385C